MGLQPSGIRPWPEPGRGGVRYDHKVVVDTLSASNQNYLKAVWSLGEWSDAPVTASALAARVGVRMSTASDAVRKLTEQGLLEHAPYGAVELTPLGRAAALTMVRRHRLIESFLVEVLGYRWDQVHDEAETLEHAISDFMVERIDNHLGRPARDPHGDPIPRADGSVQRPDAIRLAELGTGRTAKVARISDDDPQLLQYFADRGVLLDAAIEVRPAAPYSEVLEISVDGSEQTLSLGRSAADAVWVERV